MVSRIDTAHFESLADPICRAHEVECVLVALVTEHGQPVLRVVIDRAGSEQGPGLGVTLADCQSVSRDLGAALDLHEDIAPGHYRLEVSSPGVDRPLVKLRDFERFAGREIKVQTRSPVPTEGGGERRNFTGQLLGVDGECVRIEVEGGELQLPHAEIVKANLVYKFA